MHKKITKIGGYDRVIEVPDYCPHCGEKMELVIDSCNYVAVYETFIMLVHCSISICHKYFALEYKTSTNNFDGKKQPGELIDYRYNGYQEPQISSNIQALSPIFFETFCQASIAEAKELNRVSGLAFRKAFEFLVKDFASYKNPDETDKVRKNSLNNVIDMYYQDMPKLNELLHITRRIGNDETHYYREFTNIDVKDLKELIYNFSLYIDMILNIEKFTEKTN